jgi:hypothetical protein
MVTLYDSEQELSEQIDKISEQIKMYARLVENYLDEPETVAYYDLRIGQLCREGIKLQDLLNGEM